MEALVSNPLITHPTLPPSTTFPLKPRSNSIHNRRRTPAFAAIDGASLLPADSTQVQITWQIFVGAIAGVTPFVVAGIEFSKRIRVQKRCKECGGSGLVLRDDDYFRCPECGGFLPWQSWRRFFWG
ncbi:uncharacterized protein LOC101220311 [Cucumis sativus]|uniref:Viral late gene transcription factor 3 zinc ribbon domain-containing protein n=1 Tax=Cucumis sativus TaxID=3659 RepID=A0A0A0L7H1_CUCSA|nr:uncharacterized protein LOC101220311 [Cucumis sativus]KGN56051.1 hypothetical protein Csa_011367 [Cucumis sativus]